MEKIVSQELNQYPQLSVKEALASYEHITLTEEELDAAILAAKMRKEEKLKEEARRERERANRKLLTETAWSYNQTRAFMEYRARNLFGERFVIDQHNSAVFELLCYYFANDRHFISMANNMGIKNPSLEKGIMLVGNFGVGKTWLMRLFAKNQRQSYQVHNAKDIANTFSADGEDSMQQYLQRFKNAVNDSSVFYQPFSGLCIDDLGTEDIKLHYGNKKNVIGDIIEERYRLGNCGLFLHLTSNLTSQQLNDFYGGRVVSRLREVVNFIELRGTDRRV